MAAGDIRRVEAGPAEGEPLRASRSIRGKRVLVFGYGKIGQALVKKLIAEGAIIHGIVRASGIFSGAGAKMAEHKDWKRYMPAAHAVFIAIPTVGDGAEALDYMQEALKRGKPVITAEKAAIASNPQLMRRQDALLRYTATVGGGTKMLKRIGEHPPGSIREIKAVVNGTLNYISSRVRAGLAQKDAVREAVKQGYAETDTDDFAVILADEKDDVIRKAVIMANHSGMFNQPVTKENITFIPPPPGNLTAKRCIVRITPAGVEVGFIEDGGSEWLSEGANNVLYVNGHKEVEGPGAGPEPTVSAMLDDYRDVLGSI